jgi:hypothetical protein
MPAFVAPRYRHDYPTPMSIQARCGALLTGTEGDTPCPECLRLREVHRGSHDVRGDQRVRGNPTTRL